jgi:hypothetical protein
MTKSRFGRSFTGSFMPPKWLYSGSTVTRTFTFEDS